MRRWPSTRVPFAGEDCEESVRTLGIQSPLVQRQNGLLASASASFLVIPRSARRRGSSAMSRSSARCRMRSFQTHQCSTSAGHGLMAKNCRNELKADLPAALAKWRRHVTTPDRLARVAVVLADSGLNFRGLARRVANFLDITFSWKIIGPMVKSSPTSKSLHPIWRHCFSRTAAPFNQFAKTTDEITRRTRNASVAYLLPPII